MLNHDYIGTEHLLLGLIHEDEGAAARALISLGVDVAGARTEIDHLVGVGTIPPSGNIPFTHRTKKVLELALREALRIGHNYIGPEHLLLGLLRLGDGVGVQVIRRIGADLDKIRERVLQLATVNRPPVVAAGEVIDECPHCYGQIGDSERQRIRDRHAADERAAEDAFIARVDARIHEHRAETARRVRAGGEISF